MTPLWGLPMCAALLALNARRDNSPKNEGPQFLNTLMKGTS